MSTGTKLKHVYTEDNRLRSAGPPRSLEHLRQGRMEDPWKSIRDHETNVIAKHIEGYRKFATKREMNDFFRNQAILKKKKGFENFRG